MSRKKYQQQGFTLVELIVVIAIISVLAAVIAPSAFRAIEKAKCSRAIAESKVVKTAAFAYYTDTDFWPPQYRLTTALNPFLTDPGVEGWEGPYVEKWSTHPWTGHIGWDPTIDLDASGSEDGCVVFDDDRPGGGAGSNLGRIPRSSMQRIDASIDDGDLSSGYVQGDGEGLCAAAGEMVILVVKDGHP